MLVILLDVAVFKVNAVYFIVTKTIKLSIKQILVKSQKKSMITCWQFWNANLDF